MASSRTRTTALTFEEMNSTPLPTLRLRQPTHASALSQWAFQKFQEMFIKAKESVLLEDGCDAGVTRKNKAKVDKMFDQMVGSMNQQRDRVKSELDNLTPDQQEDVINFWGGVQEFMGNLLDWLRDMFSMVLDKIKQGFQLVKDTLKSIFGRVYEAIKNAFR